MKQYHIKTLKTKLPGTACPHCGGSAEGATAFDDEKLPDSPKPEDIAVCLYCGALNQYDNDMKLRAMTPAEEQHLLRDPRLREALEIARATATRTRRRWQ